MPKTSRYFHYFHSLRHSHVALLLYYGVDVYAISKRLGHADLTTTTRKYSYLIDEFKAKSDDHIEDLLNNFSTKKENKKNSIKNLLLSWVTKSRLTLIL